MTLNEVIFIDNLPTLDLHGYDIETATVAILDFIRDNIKLKNEVVVIVTGVGSGIIRKTTHEVLRKHKNVLDFKVHYLNEGATIVRVKF